VFPFLLALFTLTAPGAINAVDVWPVIGEAAGLVELGTFDYQRLDAAQVGVQIEKCNHHGMSGRTEPRNKFGFGLHTGFVPAYLLAKAGAAITGRAPLDVMRTTAAFLNPLAGAAIGAMVLALLFRLGFAVRASVGATLLITVGTFLWPLTGISYTDPLQTAWLVAVFLQALRARDSQRALDLHLLGFLALVTCLTKLSLAPLVACLCLVALPAAGGAWSALAILSVWAPATVLAQGLVSWARFGDPLDTGYASSRMFSTPLLDGLELLFVSPSRGLIWFFPLLPLALFGTWRLWRRERRTVALIAVGAALHVAFHARLEYVHGGHCLGPRYLLPLVPLSAPASRPP
jgi:hypothetical protein